MCVWISFYAALAQYSHRYCHMPPAQRPALMNVLSRVGVVNSPEFHAMHHQTLDQAYPILNGCSEPAMRLISAVVSPLDLKWLWITLGWGLLIPFVYRYTVLLL